LRGRAQGLSQQKRVAVAEEQLGLTPKFIHPAFPERKDYDEEIKLGMAPDTRMWSKVLEKANERINEDNKVLE
jgi:hypothetical protein